MEQTLKIIGKIHSALKTIEDCPLQENENAPEAIVEIFPEFLEGIKNIKTGFKNITTDMAAPGRQKRYKMCAKK